VAMGARISRMAGKLVGGGLRIWKHSHGTNSFTKAECDTYRQQNVITIYRETRKGQGVAFRTEMSVGDFFYLTHGNDVQLFGQITSALKRPRAEWVEREYVTIRSLQSRSGHFRGSPKWWAPNANMTCVRIPEHDLMVFEKTLLLPFFQLRSSDLENLPSAFVGNELDGDIPSGEKFEEARKRLTRNKALERVETVRNRRLVSAAKRAFKRKHGRLFCEVCDLDFSARYGERGKNYIEAHHIIPISRLTAMTVLTIADLAMVCANCHRMLHRLPWISIKKLRSLLDSRPHD
jgi:hypothetical protein